MFSPTSILILVLLTFISCNSKNTNSNEKHDTPEINSPGDIIPLDGWDITLGNGEVVESLESFSHPDYFFTIQDQFNWVVFKTPNSGITTKNSHNTRTELKQEGADEDETKLPSDIRWTPEKGGNLKGTLKVMHVSTSGDKRVAASFSVVVGQIHSSEGHENEPLKIFYKKFPDHEKGSVFWNYEINTEGDNSGRWDYSTAIWGYDMSIRGYDSITSPEEPEDGIELGEEFSYEINVFEGMLYLKFESPNHETKTFTKNLIESEYTRAEDLPEQIVDLFVPIGRNGLEKVSAYKGEKQFFAQGAYNQANGKDRIDNKIWSTASEIYDGDLKLQYQHGSYAEVWFRKSRVSEGKDPNKE